MANFSWQWSAFGKHPVATDFFRLGKEAPLLKGFSDWVEKGYQALISRKNTHTPSGHSAWRFWARGSQKEHIACGVIRDSSDSVGRPYPLLIMGTGPLSGWEDHWDLLPFACDRSWGQIEYLSALVANDFKKLEAEVRHIRSPSSEWSDWSLKRKEVESQWLHPHTDPSSSSLKEMEERASTAPGSTEFIVSLDPNPMNDQFAQVSFWHYLFKNQGRVAPNAIFMGGSLEKACLAMFRRPLVPADFVQLWSVSSATPSPFPSPLGGEG